MSDIIYSLTYTRVRQRHLPKFAIPLRLDFMEEILPFN